MSAPMRTETSLQVERSEGIKKKKKKERLIITMALI